MRNNKQVLKSRANKSAFRTSTCKTQTATPSIFIETRYDFWNVLKGYWQRRYGHVHFRLMDINCLAYVGMIGVLLVFFHNSVLGWPFHVFIHVALIIGVLEILRLGERYTNNKFLWMLRTFYPVLLFLYMWEELEALVSMLYGSHWATEMIVRWDKLVFGVHPTVWFQQFYNPWLNELMNFFYAGYYTFFILVPLSLFLSKKKEAAMAVLSMATFVYFSNFILFYLLPVLSPSHFPGLQELHTGQQTGYLFAEINRIVQSNGAIHGGAFPSSHVAGAFAWALGALRYKRKLGYVLIPMAFGIAVATVYLRLHHGLDPLIGSIWGVITFTVALKLVKARGEDPLTQSDNRADNN